MSAGRSCVLFRACVNRPRWLVAALWWNTLKVTGDINMIDVEDVDLESLSLKEFEVQVTRVGYGARTVRLSARTDEEAIDIAGDDAGNHSYSEHHSDYLVAASVV